MLHNKLSAGVKQIDQFKTKVTEQNTRVRISFYMVNGFVKQLIHLLLV